MKIPARGLIRTLTLAGAVSLAPTLAPAIPAQDTLEMAGAASFELRTVPAEAVPEDPDEAAYREAWKRVKAGVPPCLETEPGEPRIRCLESLVAHAGVAVDRRPERPEGHYWLAVAVGLQVDHLGGRDKVKAASRVYREATEVLRLDPEHPGAHHILGRLQAGVLRMGRITRFVATRFLGGEILGQASWEEAEALLSFAEEHDPGVPEHHYELAALHRDRDRPELARREARHVLALPRRRGDREVREQAARLLEELKDR